MTNQKMVMLTMKIPIAITAFAIIAVVGISAVYAADTVRVDMPSGTGIPGCDTHDTCFVPHEIHIDAGDLVTWANSDTSPHFVTAGDLNVDSNMIGVYYPNGFDSGVVMAGESFTHKFDTPGAYPYFCMMHPWRAGVVYVGLSADASYPPPAARPSSTPVITDPWAEIDRLNDVIDRQNQIIGQTNMHTENLEADRIKLHEDMERMRETIMDLKDVIEDLNDIIDAFETGTLQPSSSTQ